MSAERSVLEAAIAYVRAMDEHLDWVVNNKLDGDTEGFRTELREQQDRLMAKRRLLSEAVYALTGH